MNSIIAQLGEYPFARLVAERRRREAAGQSIIDFGMGDPREVTPPFIRAAMAQAIPEISSYPTVRGGAELRQSIAGWCERRFGVSLDPETEILPTQGSKEGIFHTPLAFLDRGSSRDTVLVFQPAYPVYESGALYAGGRVVNIVLGEENGFLPDLDAIPDATWRRTSLCWLNYPHNPTGCLAGRELYGRALELATKWDFILCVDECYVDLYFDEPPRSALELGRRNLLVFHSLSKRSAMTGFRSGFVAGDPSLVATLAKFRPTIGCAMPEPVQAASIAAWDDDAHAAQMRDIYRAKREALLPALLDLGLVDAGGASTFYLWLRLPRGVSDESLAEGLLASGLMVCPGSYLGMPAGDPGYVRLALVPSLEDCARAREVFRGALPQLLSG